MIQPGQYDITVQRRGDFDIGFQLKDSDDDPVVLTGSTVEAQIWSTHRRAKLADFTVDLTDENLGKFSLSLTEAQTELLPDDCYYDVRITDSLGNSYYWVRGKVTSAGIYGASSSSIKYKKDVEDLDPALVTNAIDGLRPVYYRTKNPQGDDKANWSHIGLIAEEVHEVEPRLVRYRTAEVETDEEGNRVERELEVPEPEDVDYARLSVLLLAEIQSLRARVAALEAA